MGYFSNGSEGMDYQERYCLRCVNEEVLDGGCPVWDAHLLFNYRQHDDEEIASVLDRFIPRDGVVNKECTMFVERNPGAGGQPPEAPATRKGMIQ